MGDAPRHGKNGRLIEQGFGTAEAHKPTEGSGALTPPLNEER